MPARDALRSHRGRRPASVTCRECNAPKDGALAAAPGPAELELPKRPRTRGERAYLRAAKRVCGAGSGAGLECPVCLELFATSGQFDSEPREQVAYTLCGHAFHCECLMHHTQAYIERNISTLLEHWVFSPRTLTRDLMVAAQIVARLHAVAAPCPVCRQEGPMQHLLALEPELPERLAASLWKQLVGSQFLALTAESNSEPTGDEAGDGEAADDEPNVWSMQQRLQTLMPSEDVAQFMQPLPPWLRPFSHAVTEHCVRMRNLVLAGVDPSDELGADQGPEQVVDVGGVPGGGV